MHDETYFFLPPLLSLLSNYDPRENIVLARRGCDKKNIQCRIGSIYGGDNLIWVSQSLLDFSLFSK